MKWVKIFLLTILVCFFISLFIDTYNRITLFPELTLPNNKVIKPYKVFYGMCIYPLEKEEIFSFLPQLESPSISPKKIYPENINFIFKEKKPIAVELTKGNIKSQVFIMGTKRSFVLVLDPACGWVFSTRRELKEKWKGKEAIVF